MACWEEAGYKASLYARSPLRLVGKRQVIRPSVYARSPLRLVGKRQVIRPRCTLVVHYGLLGRGRL